MRARPPASLLLLTLLAFGSLYTPQPLLPELAASFGVQPASASLLISVTMLPLAVAPLLYGFLLEGVPVQRMIFWSGLGLAGCQWGLSVAVEWWQLVALRGIEGLCLPALFTALMTSISTGAPAGRIRQSIAWYIATSILGGFSGRALSGIIADSLGWRAAFGVWALGLVAGLLLQQRRGAGAGAAGHFVRPHPRIFGEVLADRPIRYAYASIFLVFLVFAGLLNALPFRLRDLAPDTGSGAIGLAYTGYLIGVVMALGGEPLSRRIGSEARVLALGIVIWLLGLALFWLPERWTLYAGMLGFCAGMFLLHGRLSGHVNQRVQRYRGVVNGLYISCYYLGGSLGSWLVPLMHRELGWQPMLVVLATLVAAAAAALSRMLRAETATPQEARRQGPS